MLLFRLSQNKVNTVGTETTVVAEKEGGEEKGRRRKEREREKKGMYESIMFQIPNNFSFIRVSVLVK